jgi:hypothetical protein
MVAGTSSTRTTDASTSRAMTIPTPSNLMKMMPEAENAATTMISSSAADVMIPPVRCRPSATAIALSPEMSYRSRIRDSRNTS